MKYAAVAATFLATFVAAQTTIGDIPGCALGCVATGLTGISCGLADFECSCTKAAQLTPLVTPCVQKSCTAVADQEKVITVLEALCAQAGFPIDIPNPNEPKPEEPKPEEPKPEEPKPEEPKPEEPKPEEPSKSESKSVAPTIQTSDAYPTATSYPEETCAIVTVTSTVTGAPYPTGGPVGTGYPSSSGGYVKPTPSAYPPEFTGAAVAMKVPAGIAALGLAALLL